MKNIVKVGIMLLIGMCMSVKAMEPQKPQKKPAAGKVIIIKPVAKKAPAVKPAAVKAPVLQPIFRPGIVKPVAPKAPAVKKAAAKAVAVPVLKKVAAKHVAPLAPQVKPAAVKPAAVKPAAAPEIALEPIPAPAVLKAAAVKPLMKDFTVIVAPIYKEGNNRHLLLTHQKSEKNKKIYSIFAGPKNKNEKTHAETAGRLLREQGNIPFTAEDMDRYLNVENGHVEMIFWHKKTKTIFYMLDISRELFEIMIATFNTTAGKSNSLAVLDPLTDANLAKLATEKEAHARVLKQDGSLQQEDIIVRLPLFVRQMFGHKIKEEELEGLYGR